MTGYERVRKDFKKTLERTFTNHDVLVFRSIVCGDVVKIRIWNNLSLDCEVSLEVPLGKFVEDAHLLAETILLEHVFS
jgi:hypothetical protein